MVHSNHSDIGAYGYWSLATTSGRRRSLELHPTHAPSMGQDRRIVGLGSLFAGSLFWTLTYLQQNVQDMIGTCFLRTCFLWGILGEPLLLEATHTVGTKNLHGLSLLQHQSSPGTRYFRQCKVLSVKRMISGFVLNRILCPKPLHVPGT